MCGELADLIRACAGHPPRAPTPQKAAAEITISRDGDLRATDVVHTDSGTAQKIRRKKSRIFRLSLNLEISSLKFPGNFCKLYGKCRHSSSGDVPALGPTAARPTRRCVDGLYFSLHNLAAMMDVVPRVRGSTRKKQNHVLVDLI
jgi:hypothetical protein